MLEGLTKKLISKTNKAKERKENLKKTILAHDQELSGRKIRIEELNKALEGNQAEFSTILQENETLQDKLSEVVLEKEDLELQVVKSKLLLEEASLVDDDNLEIITFLKNQITQLENRDQTTMTESQ